MERKPKIGDVVKVKNYPIKNMIGIGGIVVDYSDYMYSIKLRNKKIIRCTESELILCHSENRSHF